MKSRGMRKFLTVVCLLSLFGLFLFVLTSTRPLTPGVLRFTFLDVGQGDSVIVQTPSGRVVVIDTGNIGREGGGDAGQSVVAPALRRMGTNHIDLLFLTHPHADHIGGAKSLLELCDVDLIMDNGQDSASPLVLSYLQKAKERNILYRVARRGQSFDLGDRVTLRVLSPTDDEASGKANNASIVLRFDYGETSAILTGDAEAEEENDLLTLGEAVLCNLYKAGHHGSKTSSTPEFLAMMHPQIAVISCGKNNLYGHPHPLTLTHLAEKEIRAYRTDLQGAIICDLDGKKATVTTTR